jgi:hypothetical protein
MVHSSVAGTHAFLAGLLVAWLPSGAAAAPSCPPGATIVTTNQTILSATGSAVKCVGSGVFVSEDIQGYGDSAIYTSADVGVDVETYSNATIHVLGGHVGANIDSYTDSTIHIYDVDLVGNASAYSNSTLNVYGGDIGGKLILYTNGRINVFASSLSSYGFGEVADLSGTVSGIFEDGSAFSLDFSRVGGLATTLTLIQVPEPGSFSLLGFSIAGMALARRRRRR